MKLSKIPRIHEVQKKLAEYQLDALLVTDPIHLFYLTQLDLSQGRLLITESDATLIVDPRYGDLASSSFSSVEVHKQVDEALASLVNNLKPGATVGFESERVHYSLWESWSKKMNNILWTPANQLLEKARMIKSSDEIQKMQKLATETLAGIDYLFASLALGMSEEDLARRLEIFWLEQDTLRPAFSSIIAFGVNGARPHHRPQKAFWNPDLSVQIDAGASQNKYNADMSRFQNAHTSKWITQAENLVTEALEIAKAIMAPGVLLKEIDTAVRDHFQRAGVLEYFTHSLGHGIGLEVHEAPFFRGAGLEIPLQEGMVLAIEPGLYKKNEGGVRIEDMVLITSWGTQTLA